MSDPSPAAPSADHAHDTSLAERLRALEDRVAQLEALPADAATPTTPGVSAAPTSAASADTFWALDGLKSRLGPRGGVLYTGAVTLGGGRYEYQWARPTEHLEQTDWAERAETVGALGHPLRLTLLQRLAEGERTVAQLVDELELGSTGVAYHHLSALQTGGWVTSPRRGTWAIPASRLIPLLAIVTALEEG